MTILISGGPGSGCTTVATKVGVELAIPCFDSDDYFHKPSDPPFQEQYSPEERRTLLRNVLRGQTNWIIGGSISNWGLEELKATHGVFLNVPEQDRIGRLIIRQKENFGRRIEIGGDMFEEHKAFIDWASGYEGRTGVGRNQSHDKLFLQSRSERFISVDGSTEISAVLKRVMGFISSAK